MRDRISQDPNRRLVTPESGTPFYATITRADNPIEDGTPNNKANLLSDETALDIGLSEVSDATVNKALSAIWTTLKSHISNLVVHLTAAERTAWNAKATTATYTATITTTWTGTAAPYTQTVTVSGILAADTPIVDAVLSTTVATARLQLAAWGLVSKISTAANSITITCLDSKPITAIPIQLKVVR